MASSTHVLLVGDKQIWISSTIRRASEVVMTCMDDLTLVYMLSSGLATIGNDSVDCSHAALLLLDSSNLVFFFT